MKEAVADAQAGEAARGASTITQQTAKNLFLWGGCSYVRKVLEIPLALWLEVVLGKQRILEIYLNIAEWGPNGEFGVEAGAQRAFGVSAADVTAPQAALLASVLPNPKRRNAKSPGPGLRRIAGIYLRRMGAADVDGCRGRNEELGVALASLLHERGVGEGGARRRRGGGCWRRHSDLPAVRLLHRGGEEVLQPNVRSAAALAVRSSTP